MVARRQVSLRTRPRREENPKNHHEEGMVTVETALSLGGVVFVALALIVAVSVAGLHGEVCQVARDAARAHSLGVTGMDTTAVTRVDVAVQVSDAGSWITASASAAPFQVGPWQAPAVRCEVTGVKEPFVGGLGGG